jgi:hypothetical protein
VRSHAGLMIVFSLIVSLVFTFIAKYGAKERLKYFLYLSACFVVLSLLAAWLMLPFPI